MVLHGKRLPIEIGQRAFVSLPYSEVCAHLRVAGLILPVELLSGGMAQIYRDGRPYSFPVTTGEAGIYRDGSGGFYTYGRTEDENLTLWGHSKRDINADEYCLECERETPRHYAHCPRM